MARNTYSTQAVRAFHRFFEEKYYSTPSCVGGHYSGGIRFNSYNFNPVFLRTLGNLRKTVLEIPTLIDSSAVREALTGEVAGESAAPLSISDSREIKTADLIFRYFFQEERYSYQRILGLKKAVTGKGEVYYGAPGLVLDSNFKPIMIGISEYMRLPNRISFSRCVLKVSPEVFISEGLLEKAIIKRIIPFYTEHDIRGDTVRVEIDDINKYVVKPVPPKANVQKDLKKIMDIYSEEILKDLVL